MYGIKDEYEHTNMPKKSILDFTPQKRSQTNFHLLQVTGQIISKVAGVIRRFTWMPKSRPKGTWAADQKTLVIFGGYIGTGDCNKLTMNQSI